MAAHEVFAMISDETVQNVVDVYKRQLPDISVG